ncbi:MAG TPA: hypothetical protein VFQ61_04315 [Polyangiaceae bacterium]|nr:hypothetical protein [Polyangiaceae bacterium]
MLALWGCNRPIKEVPRARAPSAARYPVEIRRPAKLSSIETGRADALGREQRVPCVTCHSLGVRRPVPESSAELEEFHRGLSIEHGSLRCASCHSAEGAELLKLADGRSLPITDSIEKCGECHGPQYRDYRHGAHGGMLGYWDLSRGGRLRNTCVDCHDPHIPKPPPVMPVLPPRDRSSTAHSVQPVAEARGAAHD